jgi:hypothetical protein
MSSAIIISVLWASSSQINCRKMMRKQQIKLKTSRTVLCNDRKKVVLLWRGWSQFTYMLYEQKNRKMDNNKAKQSKRTSACKFKCTYKSSTSTMKHNFINIICYRIELCTCTIIPSKRIDRFDSFR